MKNKKRTSFRSVAWLLCVSMLLLWGVGVSVLTLAVTEGYMDMLLHNDNRRAESVLSDSYLTGYLEQFNGTPVKSMDYVGYTMMWAVIYADESNIASSNTWAYKLLNEKDIPVYGAAVVRDKDGNRIMQSGDVLVFRYTPAEEWEKGYQSGSGSGWIDLSADPQLQQYIDQLPTDWDWGLFPFHADITLRVTGRVGDLGEIEPLKLDYTKETGRELWNGGSEWTTVFDCRSETDTDLVTAYIDEPVRYTFCEDRPVVYDGETYENVLQLVDGYYPTQTKLNNLIIFDLERVLFLDSDGEPVEYSVEVVKVYNPLKGAAQNLRHVYICSFVLMLMMTVAILLIIRRNLTRPLFVLNAHMAGDWQHSLKKEPKWREPLELEGRFTELTERVKTQQDRLQKQENEIHRLNQALEYAKRAEESRRQMTSGIAHELKTPLAIIHSYTESLQENIAEEKRDQYLATILSETERVDSLVLEMLDLSRLEAGRVTLARDVFSLAELTRNTFSRLKKTAAQKRLKVSFDVSCDGTVCADENRLGQAVMNFSSNAVRYTPEGGSIRVKIWEKSGKVWFSVENDARHFTEEEQSRVWETFYRTDQSRHEKGTGLGLAIARSIVRLHGGDCTVRNTDSGVEFGFFVPTGV